MAKEDWVGRYSVDGGVEGGGIAEVKLGGESDLVFINEKDHSTKGHLVTDTEARTESNPDRWEALKVTRQSRPEDGVQELYFSDETTWVKFN